MSKEEMIDIVLMTYMYIYIYIISRVFPFSVKLHHAATPFDASG